MHNLTVLAFDNPTQTYQVRDALLQLQGESLFDLAELAVVTRDDSGTVTFHQANGTVAGCASAGSVIGLILGAIFTIEPNPMNTRQLNSRTRAAVPRIGRSATRTAGGALLALMWTLPLSAQASIFQGEALDKMADILTWVVLIVAPLVGIAVFWLVHILPEKIAEKRQHPQAKAIQCLCLLSLVFGGLLWPLAWLWAYSKPVLHQIAYGTDKEVHGHTEPGRPAPTPSEAKELQQLRQRVAELETRLAGKSAAAGEKV